MISAPLHLLDKTVTVQRAAEVANALGSTTRTWATHLTAIKARVHELSQTEAIELGAMRGTRVWRVQVAPNQDVTNKDRLLIGSITARITGVRKNSNAQSIASLLVIDAEEIGGVDG